MFCQSEPVAALRSVPVFLTDLAGDGIAASDFGGIGTLTIKVSKNGGAFAAAGGTLTELTSGPVGAYQFVFTTTDVNTQGVLQLAITKTGEIRPFVDGYVIETRRDCIRYGTAAGGAAGSITLDGSASATDDFYASPNRPCRVRIVEGTGAGQSRFANDYVGSTKVLTVTQNWATNPDSTSVFILDAVAASPESIWDVISLSSHRLAGSFGDLLQVLCGLNYNNAFLDNTSYGANAVLTSARIRIFADKTATDLAADGAGNGTQGEIARYAITAVDAGSGEIDTYKMTREA